MITSTRERERAVLPGKYCSKISHLKQNWTPLYGDILHAITENNDHDRFAVALEHLGHGGEITC